MRDNTNGERHAARGKGQQACEPCAPYLSPLAFSQEERPWK